MSLFSLFVFFSMTFSKKFYFYHKIRAETFTVFIPVYSIIYVATVDVNIINQIDYCWLLYGKATNFGSFYFLANCL